MRWDRSCWLRLLPQELRCSLDPGLNHWPSIGPRLALASSCERIRDAIPFLPTESLAEYAFGSQVDYLETDPHPEGHRVCRPAVFGPPDRCRHVWRIRDLLGHPLGGGKFQETLAGGGWRRKSARGQGREEFAGDGGDDLAFGGVVGGEDHQDDAAACGQFDERGIVPGLAGEAAFRPEL